MNHAPIIAYIALGSNLEFPEQQLNTALTELRNIPQITFNKASHFYRSTPLTNDEQPDYINAVVAFETNISAHELLDVLRKIEQQHGRVRTTKRWGARTLDLDLILYGNQIINTPRLIVPHPGLIKRNFVLYPLAEIAPNLMLPNGQSIQELLEHCPKTGLTLL